MTSAVFMEKTTVSMMSSEYRQELNLSGLFASSLEGCGLSDLWFLLGANIPWFYGFFRREKLLPILESADRDWGGRLPGRAVESPPPWLWLILSSPHLATMHTYTQGLKQACILWTAFFLSFICPPIHPSIYQFICLFIHLFHDCLLGAHCVW